MQSCGSLLSRQSVIIIIFIIIITIIVIVVAVDFVARRIARATRTTRHLPRLVNNLIAVMTPREICRGPVKARFFFF